MRIGIIHTLAAASVIAGGVFGGIAAGQTAAFPDFSAAIAGVGKQVQPSILYLKCSREDNSSGRQVTESVSGSGFLISADGEFVTNWHVVDKAASVRALLTDGRRFDAEVIGSDKATDLALCRLKLPEGEDAVVPVGFGDSSKLSEGDMVLAFGAPWGLNRTVTFGTVSCARRYIERNSEYSHWIQTDADIGPGNSGGPLVNLRGEVVGVNALGMSARSANFGFAIPAEIALPIIGILRRDGKVNWSWCGIYLQPLRDFEKNTYFPATNGVIVAGMAPDSPAAAAGLRAFDRIVRINGSDVTGLDEENLPDIRRLIGLLPETDVITLDVARGGEGDEENLSVVISPREKGEIEGKELSYARWNFSAKEINRFDNPTLFLHRKKGVFVFGMQRPGNAQRSELAESDIIISVDGVEIETLGELSAAHEKSIAEGSPASVAFQIMRKGRKREIVLDFSRDYEEE